MQPPSPEFSYSPEQLRCCLEPLANEIYELRHSDTTIVVGIQGGQGTGKTTLVRYLAANLSHKNCRVVTFSIDDFYSSYEKRKLLAAKFRTNPFYQIPRGMPGTHRVSELVDALSCLKSGNDTDLPIFDKSLHQGNGDISDQVTHVRGRQDFVLFEGWCVGIPETTTEDLIDACNHQGLSNLGTFFAPEHIAEMLSRLGPYQRAWDLLDFLVMLRPDSLDLHEKWRTKQEQDLIARTGTGLTGTQISNMVKHFLPLTCLCYEKAVPDLCIRINKEHRYYRVEAPK